MDVFFDCIFLKYIVSNSSKSNHNHTFVKTKIKSYRDEVTDFHDKEMPKVESNYTFLVVILIDLVFKKD